jgi:D-glycerate 3-kinase
MIRYLGGHPVRQFLFGKLYMSVDSQICELLAGWVARYGGDKSPGLIGISGAQGSGKSYLAREVAVALGAAHFSLDDVYLTKAERANLAQIYHPLFATRGAPLTHDLVLAVETIERLRSAKPNESTPLPAFDKRTDDRVPPSQQPHFKGRPRAIIIEGWCLGAAPLATENLLLSNNDFEREHDPNGTWRTHWNQALGNTYKEFYAKFDAILFLAAPSFDVVLDWRCEQEEALLGIEKGSLPTVRRQELALFVASFERLTRHMLEGGVGSVTRVNLDKARGVTSIQLP